MEITVVWEDFLKWYTNTAWLKDYQEPFNIHIQENIWQCQESRCRRKVRKSSYMLGGYVGLNSGDEENLIRAVENIGPVSI
ncbi:hypothetical protein MXB_4007, partial [Myxobolus squamalis]